jgi:hypothetical protein
MNKLQKEKRDRIVLVCIGTGVLLAAVYFLLINPEYNAIARTKAKTVQARSDLQDKIALIKRQGAIEGDSLDVSTNLAAAEHDIAVGDPNAWFYDTLRTFKGHYDVEISGYSPPSLGDVDLLPHFPYKQLKITVNGMAFFHDLGNFVADLENTFPHMRVVNLALDPGTGGYIPSSTASGSVPGSNEKLSFRMEIVTLVKTGETHN